jgi:signal peptidase II
MSSHNKAHKVHPHPWQWGILLSISVIVTDQITKHLIRLQGAGYAHTLIPGILSLTNQRNTGAAFSILRDSNGILMWFAIMALGAVIYWHDQLSVGRLTPLLASLFIGGVIGNLIDRISLGAVTDFITFSFWPSFNVADTALSISVILYGYLVYRHRD